MIDFLLSILLAVISPAWAQNTETFQNYMSSRASAGTINSLQQTLILQSGQVRLGSLSALGGAVIASGVTRGGITNSTIGTNAIVVNGNTAVGDSGYGAIYTTAGCTAGGLRAIADATGQFWCLTLQSGVAAQAGWFNAKCDGATDDSAAFKTAILSAQSVGIPLRFVGTCIINTPPLVINKALDFGGYSDQLSILQTTVSNVSAQVVSLGTTPIQLHDYQCNYTAPGTLDSCFNSSAPAGQANFGSRIWNVVWNGGVGATIDQWGAWTMDSAQLTGTGGFAALIIRQTTNGDAGDMKISKSQLACSGATTIGLDWESGGGLNFVQNKVIGTTCLTGVLINYTPPANANTGDLFLTSNSIEGVVATPNSICIKMVRTTTGGSITSTIINGNEMSGCQTGISIPHDANGPWLDSVNIANNVISGASGIVTNIAFNIASVLGMVLSHNSFLGNATSANQITFLENTVQRCVVGPNIAQTPTTIASSIATCTSYIPF